MSRYRVSFWIAGICLPYWILLYVFIFYDLYLASSLAGFLLKVLAPFAFIANLTGVGLGLASWSKDKVLASVATAFNALPLISVVGFVWWLWFGVKI